MSELLYARLKADLASILREYFTHEQSRELAGDTIAAVRSRGFAISRQRIGRDRSCGELDREKYRTGNVSGVGRNCS